MKILIVSWFFPPYNAIGAVRVGKIAKFLRHQGHDVRVISARNQPLQESLPVEVPEQEILRTNWVNLNAPADLAMGGSAKVKAQGYHSDRQLLGPLLAKLKPLYRTLVHIPDAQIGWLPFALLQGQRWLQGWKPDLIYASMLPITSLLVAATLAKTLNAPWVAELRDLAGLDHIDHDYYSTSRWRMALDIRLMDTLLATTSGLVTVSEPMAAFLRQRYNIPAQTVLNGFDPSDFPPDAHVPYDNGQLNIVHTGMLYGGLRDPRPLFKAIQNLPAVKIHFYGRDLAAAETFAKELGVSDQVLIHGLVPYAKALSAQACSDVQLLLMVDHAHDNASFTGKMFEYIGNRRPILALGRDGNVACQLVTDRHAGFVSLDPDAIRAQLERWLAHKAQHKLIPEVDAAVREGLSREAQVATLGTFLKQIRDSSRGD